jgi:hypothetical protein
MAEEVDSATAMLDSMAMKLDSMPVIVDLVVGELESIGGARMGSNGASLLCEDHVWFVDRWIRFLV